MMLGSDKNAIKGARLQRSAVRRAWGFARPYRTIIVVFLVTIFISALLELVPPFAFRAIIDDAIPKKDRGLIKVLAGFVVASAIADAMLAIVQRWCSARIGEGLIYDLRVALFAKVQRMPVAFFTRTQTGALSSRLNNDVVGAQNAVTSTLGSVVSNVIVLITTLIAMVALEWRLTLLALIVLPLFIIPAKRVGKRFQEIARQQMNTNAEMNSQMSERFNVAGAQLVKLFGRSNDETSLFSSRAVRVRDLGIKSAMYGRVFFVALGLVGALGAAAI
ncbi:MAG: ATP-binding cassette, subfamily bacterial, partial [Ilumatobacteraceae bacterium]